MDSTQELIRTLLGKAENIAIFLSSNAKEHEFLLKEALKSAFLRTGKSVISLPEDDPAKKARWQEFIKPASRSYPEKIFIRLPRRVSLEEVTENGGSTFVLSSTEAVSPEEISISRGLAVPDAVISFSEGSGGPTVPNEMRLPSPDKILFLGARTRALTEKVSDIIRIVAGDIKEEAPLILAALMLETRFFRIYANPVVFALGKELMEAGAPLEKIRNTLAPSPSQGILQLLGRALARSFKDDLGQVFWTFLALRDFEKTHMSPDRHTITALKDHLEDRFFETAPFLSLLLWEDRDKKVWGFASSEKSERVQLLKSTLGVGGKGESFFFGPYDNFSTAELQMKSYLKDNSPGVR